MCPNYFFKQEPAAMVDTPPPPPTETLEEFAHRLLPGLIEINAAAEEIGIVVVPTSAEVQTLDKATLAQECAASDDGSLYVQSAREVLAARQANHEAVSAAFGEDGVSQAEQIVLQMVDKDLVATGLALDDLGLILENVCAEKADPLEPVRPQEYRNERIRATPGYMASM
jgi:hypothetical protein